MISDQATHPDRRGRRKAKTTEAILDAGERLFLTQGFQATTVEQLATEADVAVGTLYGHFGGKEGVYAALIDRALELDARYCDEAWDRAHDPVGRLLAIADGYLRFAREHPGYFRLFRFPPEVGPSTGPTGVATARIADRVRSEIHRMTGALREAIDEGAVRVIDPERAAMFLWAAWDGLIAAHLLPAGLGLTEDQFDELLALGRETLARGLLNPEAVAS